MVLDRSLLMTFSPIAELALNDIPVWVVALLALTIVWPGIVGCVHQALFHFTTRMILSKLRAPTHVAHETSRRGARSLTVVATPVEGTQVDESTPTAPPTRTTPDEVRSA
ncbi:hypothetical protein DMB37_15570 [Nocardia sp. CS682]|nr:hypothetical protein DMB37_15570 [Nocardia sp. CS682]